MVLSPQRRPMAAVSTMAQQDPNRTFYRYNMNLVNPAFAAMASIDAPEYPVSAKT